MPSAARAGSFSDHALPRSLHTRQAHAARQHALYKSLPAAACQIVTWRGKSLNVKDRLVSMYAHLARCPFRHSESPALAGRPECGKKTLDSDDDLR